MSPEHRQRFDDLLRDVIDELPASAKRALEEISIVVDDLPDKKLAADLVREGLTEPDPDDPDPHADVMGLHTGQAITERSLGDTGSLPTIIHLFREPIVEHALEFRGGVEPLPEGSPAPRWGDQPTDDEEVYEEIRITLLHEIGHHFGLDEDDLDELGYA
ncbi:MAG TPA: metallopeptidase family protein [Phycisphaerales bacterium]|nr:metallopeptidase family protein [Phycisphaerales bacterium]